MGSGSTHLATDSSLDSAMDTRPVAHRVYAPEADRPCRPGSEAEDVQLLMETGFAVGDAHQSMFTESLASSERILGATNAQRPSSPSWMRGDVLSTHFDASRGRGAKTRIEKSHIYVCQCWSIYSGYWETCL